MSSTQTVDINFLSKVETLPTSVSGLITQKSSFQNKVGPSLAQLVERLAHRYSESTSSNPSNLTSATVCGDRTGCAPAAKRLASIALEMDLGECTLHSPPQKVNKFL